MGLPGTPHVARIGLLWTFGADGQQCENVFHVRDTLDLIFLDPVVTCNRIQSAANANIADGLAPNISLTGVSFEDVRTVPFGGITVGQAPHPGDGADAGADIPSSNCIAIRKNTASLGRGGRGRWYWPLGRASALAGTNDTLDAGHIARYENALTLFAVNLAAGVPGMVMGVVSYHVGGALRSEGLFSPILSFTVADAIVDSQRRRLTGRGR